MTDFLDTLNDRQLEAVRQVEGPVLIMAGAGSGKTKALTCRIAYMLRQGIRPGEILAITFTNKAAKEMKERVHGLIGPAADRIWISTFHSFGVRFLRREINNYPPYNEKFTIYDSDDSKQLVKNVLKELNLDDKMFPPNAVQGSISNAKNKLLSPKAFRKEVGGNFYNQRIADCYDLYDKHMKQNNALDFDDLLFVTTALLANETIRKRWQDRFHYILIDEYQDTNHAQYLMAKYITGNLQNICAVGDADQSIYSWRGADLRNIMDFKSDYPRAKIIKLEQNYRSTQTILDAANAVIANNPDRPSKTLWTSQRGGSHLQWYTADDEHDEAEFIVNVMKKKHEENREPYGNMAVLYRMNAQSRVLEELLVKRGIAYTMVGGTKFYDRAEIRDIMAYLKVINNFRDNISLARIINVPKRGIGNTTVQKLNDYANEGGMSMFEGIMAVGGSSISSAAQAKLQKFAALIFDFLNASTEGNVFDLIQKIMTDTGYLNQLQESDDPQAQSREENLGELLSVAKDFVNSHPGGGLQDFLEQVALVNDVDTYQETDDKVTLMTMHSAKGLEFPIVFLPGMDEGIFPGVRSLMDESKLEEERRLCYVAITRAKKELYLSNARMRTMYGQLKPYIPSRFLDEIPPDLVDQAIVRRQEVKMQTARRWQEESRSRYALSDSAVVTKPKKTSVKARYDWQVGDIAVHNLWGKGKVLAVTGKDKSMVLKVEFPGNKVRQLMVAYAPITKEE
ncbi:DNA helicase PcrA [Dialister sp.]|uniref:DNA helicase PcrA n=1 Tax=Dialister sp. TaxID=1955814 RepID=UPI002E8054CB|nr:DNA helicase PcrA [Dialister sp.]MEE3452237.1 DNA helicase PcrA [Dialister sp.]